MLFAEEGASESLHDQAFVWLVVALSENNLLVYCVQEAVTDAEVLRAYDSWVSLLYINKADVLSALTTLYKNHHDLVANHPLVKRYHEYLEEQSRKRLEANREIQERLIQEEKLRREEQKRQEEAVAEIVSKEVPKYQPLTKELSIEPSYDVEDELPFLDVRLSFHPKTPGIKKKDTVRDLLGIPVRLNLFKPQEIQCRQEDACEYDDCFLSSTEDENEDDEHGERLYVDNVIKAAPALRPDQIGYWRGQPIVRQSTDDFYVEMVGGAPGKSLGPVLKPRMSLAPPLINALSALKEKKEEEEKGSQGDLL